MTPTIPIRRFPLPPAALVVAALAASCPALAGEPAEPPPPPPADFLFVANGGPVMALGATVDFIGGEGSIVGEVVAGKPYSADAVTVFTQRLADGNRITHTNRARVYRDAEGRTRREHALNALGTWQTAGDEPATMIVIDDPVAGISYILDPHAKTARRMPTFRAEHDAAAGVVTWEAAVPAPLPPGSSTSGSVTVAVVGAGPAAAGEPGTFEVPLPPPAPGGAVIHALPPIAAAPAVSPLPASDARTEDLGEQDVQGVLAKGTRQTQIIAAGAIGNERAIEIVSEQWYSPDLEAVVLRRNNDPRFGETTYELANLVRGEPSADLFGVPADYELVQVPGNFGVVTGQPVVPED